MARAAWEGSPVFVRRFYKRYLRHFKNRADDGSAGVAYRLSNQGTAATRPINEKEMRPFIDYLQTVGFFVHLSEGPGSLFHLQVWYDSFLKVDPHPLVVVRSRLLFDQLVKERPEVDLVYIRSVRAAEWLINQSQCLKAILYVANTGNNVHLIRFNHLKHIFIGHGDSDKTASCHKFFRVYDEVWVAGLAHIHRFRQAGFDYSSIKFKVVGRPQARQLIADGNQTGFDEFLYLPTWEGYNGEQSYCSLRLVEAVLGNIAVAAQLGCGVKVHPFTGTQDPTLLQVEKRLAEANRGAGSGGSKAVHVFERSQSATALMAAAAFLVADISSVVSDFLVTGRPIFLYVPDESGVKTSSSGMSTDKYCYVFSTAVGLLELVDRVIVRGDDYLETSRLEVRGYFVDIERTKNHQFENELRRFLPVVSQAVPKQDQSSVDDQASHPRNLVIAHRGVAARAPENSLSAFRQAIGLQGLDGVEFDVHMTRDGQLVIMHDADLGRTTNGAGTIGETSFGDLAMLRLKSHEAGLEDAGAFSDEGIPTLSQVLEILAPGNLELHIELKNSASGSPYKGMARKVLAAAKERGLLDRCILTSFTPSVLEEVRYLDGSVRLLASVNMRVIETLGGMEQTLKRFQKIDNCLVAFDRNVLKACPLLAEHGGGLHRFGAWVVNNAGELREAFRLGYRQVTTDNAELAIRVRGDG